jgi:anti-anti-sigma regulatory factor
MLRITVEERGDRIVFRIEGKLRGPWVPELERCWRSTATHTHAKFFSVDLDHVDFVDDRGKALLTEMNSAGVELIATGCAMRSIVQQIAAVDGVNATANSAEPE